MGVVSDAHDADGDGVADARQRVDGGMYDGKEEEFAKKLAEGETLVVAGLASGNVKEAVHDARKIASGQ